MRLDTPVLKLPQVSNVRSKALLSLGIKNIRDLINFFPKSYLDLSSTSTILDAKIGFNFTISGVVHEIIEKQPKPDMHITQIAICDKTGTLIISAFKQPWLINSISKDNKIVVCGKVEFNYGFKRMTNPIIHIVESDNDAAQYAKIIPIYASNEKISSSWILNIQKKAFEYLGNFDSYIPEKFEKKYKLMDYFDALKSVHFPKSMSNLAAAQRTIKYSEVFLQQFYMLKNLETKNKNKSKCLNFECNFAKLDTLIQTISMYKELSLQTTMLSANEIFIKQFYNFIESEFKKYNVRFLLLGSHADKSEIEHAINKYNNKDIDLIISTNIEVLLKLKTDSSGLLVVDEKNLYEKKQIDSLCSCFNNCEKVYLSSHIANENFNILLYPDCQYYRIPYKSSSQCEINIFRKDNSMEAYDQAVKHLQNGGQALIFIDKSDFKFQQITEQMFNGWSLEVINEQTKMSAKLSSLEKFKQGKLELLVCTCKYDFVPLCSKDLLIIIDDTKKWSMSKLHEMRSDILLTNKNCKINLINYSKKKYEITRLDGFIKIQNGGLLFENDLFVRGYKSSLGLDDWGFGVLKLIDLIKDNAIIKTANKDILEADFEINKFLKFESSKI